LLKKFHRLLDVDDKGQDKLDYDEQERAKKG
jgi:hypothetical protein